jgi:uncharacterized protein (TIGR03086 family)
MFMPQAGRMTNMTQQMTDPRQIHRRAMAQTESIVAAVDPGQLGEPTPCPEYDVRALLSHIVGGLVRVAIVGEGGDALARPARADDVPDDGWLAAYRAASARASAAWADDAKLDALVEVPWGTIPGRFALAGYVQEILTHGWDLAKATGQPTERDPELASWALAGARRVLPPDARGADVPFGPVVQVAADAGVYAQLAAWLGRQP